jgi:hypothetical protein
LEAEEKCENQNDKSQKRVDTAITARTSGLKIGIMNFRQGTPFPSGNNDPENGGKKSACMATRDSHALLSHWNQEKRGGGRWKEGARLGPDATTYKDAPTQRSLRSKVGATHDGGKASRQAVMTR